MRSAIRTMLAVALFLGFTGCKQAHKDKPKDRTPPVVAAFTVPAQWATLAVPITALSATDDVGVTGYLVTESATPPLATDPGWSAAAPTSHAVPARGAYVLHAWARDAAGNVSAPRTATVSSIARLTVLFTTDEHSHLLAFEPEVDDFPLPTTAGTGALVGGVARRAAVLDAQRADALVRSADTITLSAGDFSQGTLASAAHLALAPDLVLLKRLGYDAVGIGNHEFDLGPAALAGAVGRALAAGDLPPLVLTNVLFDAVSPADDALAGLYGPGNAIAPSRIVVTAGGLRVGIVAVMGVAAGTVAAGAAPVRFWDPAATTPAAQFASIVATVQPAVSALRAQGVDAVVVLGHGGIGAAPGEMGDDERLAAFLSGVDLVVSGHSHRSTAAPILIPDPDGHLVPVVQARPYGEEVGRVELVLDGSARPSLDDAQTRFISVDDRVLPTASAPIRSALDALVMYLEAGFPGTPASFLELALGHVEGGPVADDSAVFGDLYFRVLGHTTFDVIGLAPGETNAMDLDTDAMLATARAAGLPAIAGLQASGAVRGDLRAGRTGNLTFADVYRVVPLGGDPTVVLPSTPLEAAAALPRIPGYPLVWAKVSTVELRAALEATLLQSTLDGDFFVGPSGLVVDYDMTRTPLFDPAAPAGPGWITRIAVVDDAGVETQVLYDVSQPGAGGTHFLVDPTALQPIVTTFYVASFAERFGITLRDAVGAPVTAATAILRWYDGTAVKDHEALARYVRDQSAANGGDLPARYADAVPRRMRPKPPAALPVLAASGARVDLAGTTWVRCEAGYPAAGQSYEHLWIFGTSTATIVHDVHDSSVDCTGPTVAANHFEVVMTLAIGPDRTVGWEQPAPTGQPTSVGASGVGFSTTGLAAKGVVFVDDAKSPAELFITNPGDPPPPVDADGYPTVLPNISSALR